MNDKDEYESELAIISAYCHEESEKEHYVKFQKHIKLDPHDDWGQGLNVLVVSDRCPGRADGLTEYLSSKTNLSSVKRVRTFDEAQAYITETIPEILIFVGYQENKVNYKIKDVILKQNPNVFFMMYAYMDAHIKKECKIQSIVYVFHSSLPIMEFVDFLKNVYETHMLLLQQDREWQMEKVKYEQTIQSAQRNEAISFFEKLKDTFRKMRTNPE